MNRIFSIASNTSASLPEFVYSELRKAILNGVFRPGEMLRQDQVATLMGVSRSPLREALPRLEAEGIVVLHPRRGYAVAQLGADEISEVFELRVLIESHVAVHALAKRTEADIAVVYGLADQMRKTAEADDDHSTVTWFDLNIAFHDALMAPAGMRHCMRALATARGVIEGYIRAEVRLTGDKREAELEHSQLAQAFVNGNADLFIGLIRSHSMHTRDRLIQGLCKK